MPLAPAGRAALLNCFGLTKTDATTTSLVHVGDWRDTLVLYGGLSYTVRFVAPFLGLMMVHCHIQKHSEYGMMALAEVAG